MGLREIPNALRLLFFMTFAAALAVAPVAFGRSATETIIVPEAIVAPDGTLQLDRAVVIRDGVIVAVTDAAQYADREDVLHRSGAVLSPGMIDVMSELGVYKSNIERVNPIDADLSVHSIIDISDPAFRTALEAGVTAVLIHPGANNVVGGTTALVRTGSPNGPPELLVADGPLLIALGSQTLSLDRAPSARAGAMAMLREAFASARQGEGHVRLRETLGESRGILFRAESGDDVTAGLRVFDRYGLTPAIAHTRDLRDIADVLAAGESPIIIDPFSLATPTPVLMTPGELARRGLAICFAGGAPSRDVHAMRTSATLAVRFGMDAAAARRALAHVPAQITGTNLHLGSIEPGRHADLVLFSADPLRPDARVLEVYLSGKRIHGPLAHEEAPWSTDESEDDEINTPASDGERDDAPSSR